MITTSFTVSFVKYCLVLLLILEILFSFFRSNFLWRYFIRDIFDKKRQSLKF